MNAMRGWSLYHGRGTWRLALAIVMGLLSGSASAATVVTDHVMSQSRSSQSNVPVTFGQIFKAGDVPQGETVAALWNGRAIPVQVDVKATNPDGSLRHAVLTAVLPKLAGGATEPLAIAAAAPSASRSPLTLAQLLATEYEATASLDIGGTTYVASARDMLMAANKEKACERWGRICDVWLRGPLVSAWVVNGPVTAADGATAPSLRVYFAVRAYAGVAPNTIGYVRTDIVVENSSAFSPKSQPRYTATLTSGSASYTSPALIHYTHTRWHKVLWWNITQPQVYLRQDTKYIQVSKAVSRYMDLKPDEAFLARLRQSCAPLDRCDQTKTMGNTGAQPSIGPLPRWTSVYIVDPDVRAYYWMLANTDALGAYSIHYRDEATGWPVSIQRHPYATIINWKSAHRISRQSNAKAARYRTDLLRGCGGNCKPANPNVWDNAHQPAESYVPYMVTGDWYYMSELAFGASHNELWSNEAYRGYSKGLIDRAHGQIRGKAWVLREMANAAYLLPDGYPLKSEFTADVKNSLTEWNTKYTNNPRANPLHVPKDDINYDMHGSSHNALAPWMHNFLTWSADHAAELGFAGAAEFRDWLARFEIGLMTDWQSSPTTGYCWLEASAYNVQVKSADGQWLPSYSAVYAATFPSLVGLVCNSPAMVAKLGKLHKKRWRTGEMSGYPNSPTGYPANFQIGLAAAVDSGLPGAATAWTIFESRSLKPRYKNFPNFAVVPRKVSGGTQTGR